MAINANTLTIVAKILKYIQRNQLQTRKWYTSRPFMAMLPKFEGFGGGANSMPVPVVYTEGGGVGGTLSAAQTAANLAVGGSQKSVAFSPTRVSMYGDLMIPGETIEATRSDAMAFVSQLQSIFEGARNKLANAIETRLFRGKLGSICQAGDLTAASDYFMLGSAEDVVHFELGDVLVYSATDGGALSDSANELTIAGIDRSSGKITYTGTDPSTWSTPYLYKKSLAYNNGGTGTYTAFSGLADWIPAAAPSASEDFYGVDRSVDSRLSGQYYSVASSGETMEDGLITALSMQDREEGAPSICLMAPVQNRKLLKEMGARKEFSLTPAYSAQGMMADVSFKGVVVHGGRGDINVVVASRCQPNIGWLLTVSNLLLATLYAPIRFIDEDGLQMLRLASDDGIESRLVFRGAFCTNAPSAHTRITFAA